MSHVFISYNQADADFAAVVMMRLEKAGFDAWIDRSRLRPGADWSDEIDSGILNAFAMVLIMSPDSKESEYVTYEWSFALGARIPVVPILRRDTEIHPRLLRLQYLDFRGDVRPWERLVDELNAIKSEKMTRWTPPRDTPSYIQRAINDLDSGNSEDRHGAIEMLAESDHQVAREALRHALTHPSRDVRARVAVTLRKLKDETMLSITGIQALKDALVLSGDLKGSDTAWIAQETLIQIGRPAYDVLAETSQSLKDPARPFAVALLSKTGGEAAISLLLAHARDTNREIVKSAVEQLGELKVKQAVDMLVRGILEQPTYVESNPKGYPFNENYSQKSDWESEAARALVRIGDTSIVPRFVEASKHPNPRVRMCASQVLGKLAGAAAIPILSELLDDNTLAYYCWRDTDTNPPEPKRTDDYFGYAQDSCGKFAVRDIAAKSIDQIGTAEAIALLRKYREKYPIPENSSYLTGLDYMVDFIPLSIDEKKDWRVSPGDE